MPIWRWRQEGEASSDLTGRRRPWRIQVWPLAAEARYGQAFAWIAMMQMTGNSSPAASVIRAKVLARPDTLPDLQAATAPAATAEGEA